MLQLNLLNWCFPSYWNSYVESISKVLPFSFCCILFRILLTFETLSVSLKSNDNAALTSCPKLAMENPNDWWKSRDTVNALFQIVHDIFCNNKKKDFECLKNYLPFDSFIILNFLQWYQCICSFTKDCPYQGKVSCGLVRPAKHFTFFLFSFMFYVLILALYLKPVLTS